MSYNAENLYIIEQVNNAENLVLKKITSLILHLNFLPLKNLLLFLLQMYLLLIQIYILQEKGFPNSSLISPYITMYPLQKPNNAFQRSQKVLSIFQQERFVIYHLNSLLPQHLKEQRFFLFLLMQMLYILMPQLATLMASEKMSLCALIKSRFCISI